MSSDREIYRRSENKQRDVMMVQAINVIRMDNDVRDGMIDGGWSAKAGISTVRIFRDVELADSHG